MKVHIKMENYFGLIVGVSLIMMNIGPVKDSTAAMDMKNGIEAEGEFFPSGPPQKKPERIEAGKNCIVDLTQSYTISGTLSGIIEFNYRILVKGPCGSTPEHSMKSGLPTENLPVMLMVSSHSEI